MESGKPVVSMEGVTLTYAGDRTPVLESITLKVAERELLAVIGPNGSGKTTILKGLLGLLKPISGTIEVLGKSPKEACKGVGYLPQKSRFDPAFPITVFDVVLTGCYRGLFKRYTCEDREKTVEVLRRVGMYELRDRRVGLLSGGQAQRVFLARAIVKGPELLLLDEPTASIDPDMQKSFYELLAELKKKMAIVLVTHDIGAISVYVDTVACVNRTLFYHGSTEGIDNLDELYNCPVDIISHGVPHRVFSEHGGSAAVENGAKGRTGHDCGLHSSGTDTGGKTGSNGKRARDV